MVLEGNFFGGNPDCGSSYLSSSLSVFIIQRACSTLQYDGNNEENKLDNCSNYYWKLILGRNNVF